MSIAARLPSMTLPELTRLHDNAARLAAGAPGKQRDQALELLPLLETEIAARRDGKWITVDVLDNGKGLPRENRQRLLEPYMTTREKGTGLGLAIVRKIIEDHGGRLELHDAPGDFHSGKGAMLRVILPALEEGSATGADGSGETLNDKKKIEHGV